VTHTIAEQSATLAKSLTVTPVTAETGKHPLIKERSATIESI